MPVRRPAGVMRWLRVPPIVAVLLCVGLSTTWAGAAPSDCTTAAALVEQKLPRRAEAVLGPLAAAECPKERASAASAVQLGASLAAKAAEELTDGDPSAAEAAARQALVHDSENEGATQTLTTIDRQRSWTARMRATWDDFWQEHLSPSVPLLALFLAVLAILLVVGRLVALGRADWPEPGTAPNAWRGWMRAGAVTGLLGGAVMITVGLSTVLAEDPDGGLVWAGRALAFVTAVVALVVGGASRTTWRDTLRSATLWSGLGILAALGADQAWLVLESASSRRTPMWLLLCVLTGGIGIWLTAWALATRLRLDIVVRGEDGAASATGVGTVVALLSELGAERPRGIEVPRGADVTALDGAFSTLPDNALLKAVKGVLVSLAGVTPWTATIEGGPASRSVSIRRNARAVDSAVIDVASIVPVVSGNHDGAAGVDVSRDGSTLPGPDASLRLAAAFILTTLAKHHGAVRSGLAGATRWESVGLHYLASTDLSGTSDPKRRSALLADALNRDPANLAAQLAYRHALDRRATDEHTLGRYREWLARFEKQEGVPPGLRLRASYTRAVIATNEAFAAGGSAAALHRVADALEAHARWVEGVRSGDPEEQLVIELEDRISGLRYLAHRGQRPSPTSPRGMYNLGCTLASRHDLAQPGTSPDLGGMARDDAEAVIWLRRAQADPHDQGWYLSDPQLAKFRRRAFFRHVFLPAPNADFFAVPAVATVAGQLRAAGFGHPRQVAGVLPSMLASTAGIDRTQAAVVTRLAEIHCSLVDFRQTGAAQDPSMPEQPRPLEAWAGELLPHFVEHGRPSLAALHGLGGHRERKVFAQQVATTVHEATRLEDELPPPQGGATWPVDYLNAPEARRAGLEAAILAWLAFPPPRPDGGLGPP